MVSVIIPYYNAEQWIAKTIDSCLEQGNLLHEVILVDDHAYDSGKEIIKTYVEKFPNTIKYFQNPSKGGNAARNYGFEKASGQYIQWLDADDVLLPGKFSQQVKALKSQGGDVCYSDWRIDYYQGGEKVKEEVRKHKPYKDFAEQLLLDNWTSPNNYLMTHHAAKTTVENQGWNESRKIGQDREFFTISSLIGHQYIYQPGIYCVYRRWSSNTVSNLEFKARLKQNQHLEKRLRGVVLQAETTLEKAEIYLTILYTHYIKALFYNNEIQHQYKVSLSHIRWPMLYPKMKVFVLLLCFKDLLSGRHQHLKDFFEKE